MDMVSLIKSCDKVEDVELLENYFQLSNEERDIAFHHKLDIMYRALYRELENNVVSPELFCDWSCGEREAFRMDWEDDSFLDHLPTELFDGSSEMPQLPCQTPEHHPSQALDKQIGDGKRKRVDGEGTSKRQKPIEYFTIKQGKQINVRKFKTSGMFRNSNIS